jgi:glycosyltransferase involved in cell wall biosynthesis
LGFKEIDERKKLMAKAKVFISATEYLECFGGSHVESLLSGTAVLTTNFGIYEKSETFVSGLDGFVCDTLDDFVWGAKACEKLDPAGIRKRAERFLMDNVKWEYQKLFDDLYCVYESSVDENKKGFSRIREEVPEWRKKLYPQFFEKE